MPAFRRRVGVLLPAAYPHIYSIRRLSTAFATHIQQQKAFYSLLGVLVPLTSPMSVCVYLVALVETSPMSSRDDSYVCVCLSGSMIRLLV